MSTTSVPDVLAELNAAALADMRQRAKRVSEAQLLEIIDALPPAIDPIPLLRSSQISVIAEVKRESPSKGALAEITEPAKLAARYSDGGATAISVLTQRHRFGGTLEDLDQVRVAVDIPVLRKDFVVDEYMLFEARAHRADLALLIVASLPGKRLTRLYKCAQDLGLTPLVEVHTREELEQALMLEANVIGINNRNLKTLKVDIRQFTRLAPLVPDSVVRVAESGIMTAADVAEARDYGADAVLVGEALVKHGKPEQAIREMIEKAGTRRG